MYRLRLMSLALFLVCLTTTSFGYDSTDKPILIARIAPMGSGFIQNMSGVVQGQSGDLIFDDSILRERTNVIRTQAEERRRANVQRIIASQNPELLEQEAMREEELRSANCGDNRFSDAFIYELGIACRFDTALSECQAQTATINDIVTSTNALKDSVVELFRSEGSEAAISGLKGQLIVKTREAIAANDQCAQTVEQTFGAGECMGSFDSIFNRSFQDSFAVLCTPEAIDANVDIIVGSMTSTATQVLNLRNIHIQNRQAEATIASNLVCANSLENILVSMRTPASEREGRPMPAPRVPEICGGAGGSRAPQSVEGSGF